MTKHRQIFSIYPALSPRDQTSLGLELLFLVCFLSGAVFEEYSNLRNKDAEAVCDLSMYNYLEVNDLYFQPRSQGFLHFLRRKSPGDEAGEELRCQLVIGGLDNTVALATPLSTI